MNERSVTTSGHGSKAGSAARQVGRGQRPGVRALEDRDARVGPHGGVELAVADVDGVDVGSLRAEAGNR